MILCMLTRQNWCKPVLLIVVMIGVAMLVVAQPAVQDRDQRILQSGSDAPVVSVESDAEQVAAERQVASTPEEDRVRVRFDDDRGQSSYSRQSTQSRSDTSSRDPPIGHSTVESMPDTLHVSVEQAAAASGDRVGVIQTVYITVQRHLDSVMSLGARSAATGSGNAASQQHVTAESVRNDADISSRAAAEGHGSAAMEHRIRDRRSTVRSEQAVRGEDAYVSQNTRHRSQDTVANDRSRVRDDRSAIEDRCFEHRHQHGGGTHHDSYHFDSHTHTHVHCVGDRDQLGLQDRRDRMDRGLDDRVDSRERRPGDVDCPGPRYFDTHGPGMHHGEHHTLRHRHLHRHC